MKAASPQAPPRVIPTPASIDRAIATGTRTSTGSPAHRYWQLGVAYTLTASLHPASAVLTAQGRLRITNASPDTLTSVHLRLDLNRFRTRPDTARVASNAPPGITVDQLVIDGDTAQLEGPARRDRPVAAGTTTTNARVTLARPVPPGDSLTIDMKWRATIPGEESGTALRQGRWGTDVFQVAQWYPRLAMYDDLNGWNHSEHDGNVEFYSPFARYDVRLDVPTGWLVGATGVLRNPGDVLPARATERLRQAMAGDSTVTISTFEETAADAARAIGARANWHFIADSVSDFAWGVSAQYEWKAAPVRLDDGTTIPLHLLYTRRNEARFARAAREVQEILLANSRLMGTYAFPQHTLLDGPEGGMEYPMLTMSDGTRLDHELWHQWFPAVVGSDEGRYAFMDEGFAAYLTRETTRLRTGTAPPSSAISRPPMGTPLILSQSPWVSDVRAALYGYWRPGQMFAALAERVGNERMLATLRAYASAWRFKHPSPWDFMSFMNHALGENLDALWYKWLFTTAPN